MKTQGKSLMAKVVVFLLFCFAIVFWSFQVFGQEWTAEQKEIWEVVVADWELLKQGNLEMPNRHDNATVWLSNKMLPFGGKFMREAYKRWLDWDKLVAFELEPLDIGIYGNVATVFYREKWNGRIMSDRARTMETWIKQDNKWLLIGRFSASCDKLPPCK